MNPYQVLVRPILTEKSGYQADVLSKYTFEVDLRANRLDVKRAVEQVFDPQDLRCFFHALIDLGLGEFAQF